MPASKFIGNGDLKHDLKDLHGASTDWWIQTFAVWGDHEAPRYAAFFLKPKHRKPWKMTKLRLSESASWAPPTPGWAPRLVAAPALPADDPTLFVVWEPIDWEPAAPTYSAGGTIGLVDQSPAVALTQPPTLWEEIFLGPITGVTHGQLKRELDAVSGVGGYVRSICAYRHDAHEDRFAYTVAPQPKRRVIQGVELYEDLDTFQQARREFAHFGVRAAHLVPLPRQRRVVVWQDERFDEESTKVGLNHSEFTAEEHAQAVGSSPRWINDIGATSEIIEIPLETGPHRHQVGLQVDTFDVAFVDTGRIAPVGRVWTNDDHTPEVAAFADLDDYMRTTMIYYGVRHAQLAISYCGALKYAATYNYVEEGARKVDNRNRFRIGSCSKLLATVAFFQLWQETLKSGGPDLLQAKVTNLLRPGVPIPLADFFGTPPTASRFHELTVDDLLYHRTGFSDLAATDDLAILARIQELRKSVLIPPPLLSDEMPIKTAQMVAYVADLGAKAFSADPGGDFKYSNMGFFLLGRIVHALSFATNTTLAAYSQVIEQMFASGLDVPRTRVRLTRDFTTRAEPIYHTSTPALKPNVDVDVPVGGMRPGRYSPYVGNAVNSDAAGGFALRATDLVRFLAAFDIREGGVPSGAPMCHPILGQDTIDAMFSELKVLNYHPPTFPKERRRGWVAHHLHDPGAEPEFRNYTAYFHSGQSQGDTTYAVRTTAGASVVASFALNLPDGPEPFANEPPSNWNKRLSDILYMIGRISSWPTSDYFLGQFGFSPWPSKQAAHCK